MKIPLFSYGKKSAAGPSPPETPEKKNPCAIILNYHEETKHHHHRFARSLGYLDWVTQPDPFRRFRNAPMLPLPLLPVQHDPLYDGLFQHGVIPSRQVTLDSLSRLFRNALAVSAWKRHGAARWALRVNPSSGNLHPTEGYAILGNAVPEIPAGVYHYVPPEHALEQRAEISAGDFSELAAGLPAQTFFVGLTSIHWREAWKYGERAYRYCQHDIGQALAAFRISAAVLGWQLVLLEDPADEEVASLLGLNRPEDFEEAEDECPDLLAAVIPSGTPFSEPVALSTRAIEIIQPGAWHGQANRLSLSHVEWNLIAEAERAARKERTKTLFHPTSVREPETKAARAISAEQIIQQRRSCLALDGVTSLPAPDFFRMLARTVPAMTPIPFDAFRASGLHSPRIHLVLFVHRVEGIQPGLYVLARSPGAVSSLRSAMHSRFLWQKPDGCPEHIDLFLLETGDFTRIAGGISCGQAIAADGAFALGMLAEFEDPVRSGGAWLYRRLFWEAGFVGQILYLEAEAAGIRSTGIGCYFDDPMHELLGLAGKQFQSLYHFTVGGPVEDSRLTTEPAYAR
ncbi:MAG TPA: SagB/ThcOx family dehydrogenase [Acidobacteriota bacterium]|nr:SagB/ThcOx family dehydrogenase [Acidobacteriota bacterium]